jgi:hypothetical protein
MTIFVWSNNGNGELFDTAAPIPIIIHGIEIPNGELALHYLQIYYTGTKGDCYFLKQMYRKGINILPGQDYAITQSLGWLTFEQIRKIFDLSGIGELSSNDIEFVNKSMIDMGCSIKMMTKEEWKSRPDFMKLDGETYLTFECKGSTREGYRFYSNKLKHGAIYLQKSCYAYWNCSVSCWDFIKGHAMEIVLTARATTEWIMCVKERFPYVTRIVHLSTVDDYFAAKGTLEDGVYIGKNMQGQILTNLIHWRSNTIEFIDDQIDLCFLGEEL